MTSLFDLIVSGGQCVTPSGIVHADLGVQDGSIVALGDLSQKSAGTVVHAKGLHILPGIIDSQVHFREPGNEHKEDLSTGTSAAVLGGVTSIFEMPNTDPPTTSSSALEDKLQRALGRAWCNYAFYLGATPENADELADLEILPGCSGIKIFMGSSTGGLLVSDDETLGRAMRSGKRRMAIHSEDEFRLIERKVLAEKAGDVHAHPDWRDVESAVRATTRLVKLAREANRRVHVLHISSKDEMDILAKHKDLISVEVTLNHLTLNAPDCYEQLGAFAQMNPPVRDLIHQTGLWAAIQNGIVDVIGSDHAPHTIEEKERPYPSSPSGMPGVQTSLPLLLNHMHEGRLSLQRIVDLTSAGPQRLFGIAAKGRIAIGYDADLVIVDLKKRRTISDDWIASKCGWTPFDGKSVMGWPTATVLRGNIGVREDEVMGTSGGRAVRFVEADVIN